MAYLDLVPQWHDEIYEIAEDDDVIGGPDGIWNLPLKQLGDNTEWLKAQVDEIGPRLDEINDEIVPESIADKLDYLGETKELFRQAIQSKGVAVPEGTPLREFTDAIGDIQGNNADVSDVVNQPWYNPGTLLGGIKWTDPTIEFDFIEILDTYGDVNTVVAEVEAGVQYWEPEEGIHKYRIRAKLPSGGYSIGVELEQTEYSIVYQANLLSITIPMTAANQVVLAFDNFVKITDADGFSISGINDELVFLDQPDVKTIRLQLATKYFMQSGTYTLSYNPLDGNTLQNNEEPIDAIVGYGVENYADYTPATFVSAQIPQNEPSTLVLVMSRPVNVDSISGFSLSGTSAVILSVISDGATIEFQLSEPADHSEVESAISLSYDGDDMTDDAGQVVEPFSNRPVSNNSTHLAISIQSAEIPSSSSHMLIVVMQGGVQMQSAAGFSLSSPDQDQLPNISTAAYTISDGTIIFTFTESLLAGKSFIVIYDGSGTLRATSNNDTITPFSQSVSNNSTDTGGIPGGTSARNLGTIVLGHDAVSVAEVTLIFEMIHNTIAAGHVNNFVDGDYFHGYISSGNSFSVSAGYDSGGAISMTSNPDLGAHGKYMTWVITGKNTWKGKNGNSYDHVSIQSKNVLGYATEANAGGHYMEATNINTNGYAGCKMRQYLLNNMLPALQALGIPFDQDWMKAPARLVSRGGTATNPGADTIADKLFLPTEYEMFGAHSYSNNNAEAAANQGRLSYYTDNNSRVKYDKDNTARIYWEASPYSGSTTVFCHVHTDGSAHIHHATTVRGVAPAFCVA
jgi:hypothetical protein